MDYFEQYERVNNAIAQISEGYRYCTLCYSPLCNCDEPKVTYKHTMAQLTWWAEIFTYEMDYAFKAQKCLPKWPKGVELLSEYNYKLTVALKLPIYIWVGNAIYDQNGNKITGLSIKARKATYGYWLDNRFFELATYKNGWQHALTQLPVADLGHELDVSGFEAILDGYFYIPQGNLTHAEFSNGLVYVKW